MLAPSPRLLRPSRRELLALAGLALPARLGAASEVAASGVAAADRKLLVVLCQGGWDTTRLFQPAFNNPLVSMEADAVAVTSGNLTWVDSPERPTVRAWMDAHHDRVAFIHGIEVRSITHERCLRLLFTGDGAAESDDWPAVLAARAGVHRPLPYLVLSGPAYTSQYTNRVVRIGDDGQLPDLLSGDALLRPYPKLGLPSATTSGLSDALLKRRLERMRTASDAALLDGYESALDDLAAVRGGGDVDLSGYAAGELCGGVAGQLGTALDAFQADLARCALVQYVGHCGPNWDQHSDISHQSLSFEELFVHLDLLMDELIARPGPGGGALLDEVTVLVCSEMGRHPQLNAQGGKDHWTYTSCMLFGAGVRGDVQVGGYDTSAFGRTVELATGDEGETSLLPGHLGATLFALGGLDPAGLVDAEPITAVLA